MEVKRLIKTSINHWEYNSFQLSRNILYSYLTLWPEYLCILTYMRGMHISLNKQFYCWLLIHNSLSGGMKCQPICTRHVIKPQFTVLEQNYNIKGDFNINPLVPRYSASIYKWSILAMFSLPGNLFSFLTTLQNKIIGILIYLNVNVLFFFQVTCSTHSNT